MKTNPRIILILFSLLSFYNQSYSQSDSARANVEALPILSYDSDVGIGFGAKLFLFDLMKSKESFDFILFGSTKGERWFKIVYSSPDFESRQGKKFPLSIDIVAEYDKYSKYFYYYIGRSYNPFGLVEYKNESTYEKINFGIFLSRGFLKDFTSTLAFQFKRFILYNLKLDSLLYHEYEHPELENAGFLSLLLNSKWDTRNSYINPVSGLLMQLEYELLYQTVPSNRFYSRLMLAFQQYNEIIVKNLVMALRIKAETTRGGLNSSTFILLPVGGSNNLRGYALDKYRFTMMILANGELRFPIWWRFGGIVGVDYATGILPNDDSKSLINAVGGLRLLMDNFVVRADVGFSKDETGFYLNFGHLF